MTALKNLKFSYGVHLGIGRWDIPGQFLYVLLPWDVFVHCEIIGLRAYGDLSHLLSYMGSKVLPFLLFLSESLNNHCSTVMEQY